MTVADWQARVRPVLLALGVLAHVRVAEGEQLDSRRIGCECAPAARAVAGMRAETARAVAARWLRVMNMHPADHAGRRSVLLDADSEPKADDIWMLRQAQPVRESYIRGVLREGEPAH